MTFCFSIDLRQTPPRHSKLRFSASPATRIGLRPTRISTNKPIANPLPRCVFLDRINRIYKILAVCKCFWRFHNPDNPLMGTIVKGQSRAIFPVRFLRSFARQFIVAFPPSRSVFEKSQSCLPLIRNPQPSPRLHRIVRLQGCNL